MRGERWMVLGVGKVAMAFSGWLVVRMRESGGLELPAEVDGSLNKD